VVNYNYDILASKKGQGRKPRLPCLPRSFRK
jgi:hypothetical protein